MVQNVHPTSKNKRRIETWMKKGIFNGLEISGYNEVSIIRYTHSKYMDDLNTSAVCDFFRHILRPYTDEVNRIWKQHKPEFWDTLFKNKMYHLPEMKALSEAKQNVRKAWKQRPKIWPQER